MRKGVGIGLIGLGYILDIPNQPRKRIGNLLLGKTLPTPDLPGNPILLERTIRLIQRMHYPINSIAWAIPTFLDHILFPLVLVDISELDIFQALLPLVFVEAGRVVVLRYSIFYKTIWHYPYIS